MYIQQPRHQCRDPPGENQNAAFITEKGVEQLLFIRKIIQQHRRDFTAEYECEGCGAVEKGTGYDDDYFHQEVVPAKKCKNCGKSAIDLKTDYRPLRPRYPANMEV